MNWRTCLFCITQDLAIRKLNIDTNNIWSKYKDNIDYLLNGQTDESKITGVGKHRQILKPELVFDCFGDDYCCKSNLIYQIIISYAIKDGDLTPRAYAIVSYYCLDIPTDLEVVYEVGRILKEMKVITKFE